MAKKHPDIPQNRVAWVWLFVSIAAIIMLGGYAYYRIEVQDQQEEKYQTIAAIGQLKADLIRLWRSERLRDAQRVAGDPLFTEAVLAHLANPYEANTKSALLQRLKAEEMGGIYANTLLFGTRGNLILSAEQATTHTEPGPKGAFDAALSSSKAVLTDFFRHSDRTIHIDSLIAIRDAKGSPIALLALRSHAASHLYPLIQSWQLTSRTGESLLVQREGESVVFLNELRHRPNTALNLRYALTQTDIPAVQAALGKQGEFLGNDYRGIPVLADLRPVPDSPWFIVTKMDKEEIFAEARAQARIIGLVVSLLIMLTAVALALAYRRRQLGLYRQILKMEQKERQAQERYRTTLYSIGDAVISTDVNGCVSHMNPVAERLTGWPETEALGIPLAKIFRIFNEHTRVPVESPVDVVLQKGQVVGLANHTVLIARDGTESPIADSGAPIKGVEGKIEGVVLVFRDQSSERKAENALHESEARYRNLFESAKEGILILNADTGESIDANPFLAEMAGVERDDLIGRPLWQIPALARIVGSQEAYRDILSLGHTCLYDLELLAASGEAIPVEFSTNLYDAGGKQIMQCGVRDIRIRKRAETEIRENEARLRSLVRILQSQSKTTQEVLEYSLNEALGLTGSQLGYIYQYSEERREFILHTWSRDVMRECSIANPQTCYELDKTGIWGEAVRQRKPILVNDFAAAHPLKKGYPEGHAKLFRFLTVPISHGDQIVAVVGVANKPTDYTESDILHLTLLMGSTWKIVEQKKAEDALKRIEWMLSVSPAQDGQKGGAPLREEAMPDAAGSAKAVIQDTIPLETLENIIADTMDLMGTCSAVCELDGRYAYRMPASGWCCVLNHASMEKTGGSTLAEARESGKWICHESCWTKACKEAVSRGAIVDTECDGGLRLYAVPIIARNAPVGSIAIAYGDPPKNQARIRQISEAFGVDFEVLHREAEAYNSRPPYIIEMAKRRLQASAQLIGAMVETKLTEADRVSVEEQLRQVQKMEAVGQLAGGVAHDFNNMLNVILGHAEMAEKDLNPTHPVQEDIQAIIKAGQRSAELTRQLLAFARKQTISPKVLDLNDTIAGMLKMLGRLIGEDISLLWRPAPSLWPARMDPVQIHQILANLSLNARDAITENGKITIETGKAEFDAEYCRAHAGFTPGRYVMMAVSDNGCGMDKATQARLFEPFFTTKGIGKGTGLGLATIYGIIRQNNGFVNVYSEPGKGTTFRIYFPADSTALAENVQPMDERKTRAGSETVLLVEDEEALLRLTKRQLEQLGYTVLAAEEPAAALELARDCAGDIHLLMTDVIMPNMSGNEIWKKLRSIRPGIPCLFMSGYTANVIAHHGVLDDGVHFLQKPFSVEALSQKVREALEGLGAS